MKTDKLKLSSFSKKQPVLSNLRLAFRYSQIWQNLLLFYLRAFVTSVVNISVSCFPWQYLTIEVLSTLNSI